MPLTNAIRGVSDVRAAPRYHPEMVKEYEAWKGWGERYRLLRKVTGVPFSEIADGLGCAESSLRSWLNGTRPIRLDHFFQACELANVDPALVLFGHPLVTEEQKKKITDAVAKALQPADGSFSGLHIIPDDPAKKVTKKRK